MASHHALENTVFDQVRNRPCTRIHGRPTYEHFRTLGRKCHESAFEIDVGYPWCDDLGLNPLIEGAAAHLRDTNKIFAEPTQLPNVDLRILPGITAALREQYTAENDKLKE